MTDQKNTAQQVLTDDEIDAIHNEYIWKWNGDSRAFARAIESALLSKLRAAVADERAVFNAAFTKETGIELCADGSFSNADDRRTYEVAKWAWDTRAALASAPAQPQACPTDVCQAAKADGVLCANDECDRSNGVRPASAPVADRQRLRDLVDVVWKEATESTAVPDTAWADRLIDKVFPSVLASAPVSLPKRTPVDDGICWSSKEIQRRQKEEDEARAAYYRSRASAPVAGEAQPTDAEIIDLAVEPLGIDCDRMPHGVVVFARNLLSRYAAPQASEAVRDALMAFDEAMSLCNDFPELQHHRDALLFAVQKARAALSAQPGAQRSGGGDAE